MIAPNPNPNANGVYEPHERLSLMPDRKGWKGVALLEIELVDVGEHWLWAEGICFLSGEMWGSFRPLCDRHGRRACSRDEAIMAAAEELGRRIGSRDCREARRMRGWLEGLLLEQAQGSLF